MQLNFSFEAIITFIACIPCLLVAIISFKSFKTPEIKTLKYFGLVFGCLFLSFLLEGLSYLFMNPVLNIIHAIMSFPATVFLFLGVNYTLKESYTTLSLIPIFGLGTLFIYLAFQPGAVVAVFYPGYSTFYWTGLFRLLAYLFPSIGGSYIFFWALRTWMNAPFEIKNETLFFLLDSILIGPVNVTFYIMSFIFFTPEIIFLSNFFMFLGVFILFIIMWKEPKILFVLPFTPYRLEVRNRKGILLHKSIWSKSPINEDIMSQFLQATRQITQEGETPVRLLDIHLKEGILLFYNLELLTIELFVSDSSKFLKDLVRSFSLEFEREFKKHLKEAPGESSKFEGVKEIINKYFSIFPSRLIDDEKKPLFLSKDYYEIPPYIDKRLKEILKEEKEYTRVKCEIQRSSKENLASEFLVLYEELEEEMDDKKRDESKKDNGLNQEKE